MGQMHLMASRNGWVKAQAVCGMDVFLLAVCIRTLLGAGERPPDRCQGKLQPCIAGETPRVMGSPVGKCLSLWSILLPPRPSLLPVPSPAAPQRWPWLMGAKLLAKPYLEKAAKIGCQRIIPQPSSAGNTTTKNKRRNYRRTPEDKGSGWEKDPCRRK